MLQLQAALRREDHSMIGSWQTTTVHQEAHDARKLFRYILPRMLGC